MVNRKVLFGERVRGLREGKGFTQENMTEKMGISAQYLSGIERGKENPTFDMLMKLSDSLKVDMWELFDYGHEIRAGELKELLKRFGNELPEEKLRLAVKLFRALAR